MANKKLLSVVAASAIAAVVTFTGCGGGSGGGDSGKSVTVSDGYVIGATVTMGGYTGIQTAPGVYVFPSGATGTIVSVGGVNDTNGNGIADNGEPMAHDMAAPSGYSNVNPFTTILVNGGMTAAELADLLDAPATETFNFDAVAKAKTDPDMARAAATLAVIQSHIANGGTAASSSSSSSSTSSSSSVSSSSSSSSTGILPDPNTSSSSSSSSSSVSSSSSSSSGTLPTPFGILPEPTASSSSSESSSSVSSSSSSSSTGILPDPNTSSSSSESSSSVSSSSSSSSTVAITLAEAMDRLAAGEQPCDIFPGLCDVFNAIEGVSDASIAASGMAALEAAIKAKLVILNDQYSGAPSSSSSVSSSSSSSSSVSSSSSSSVSSSSSSSEDTPPDPGTIPDGSSSSSSSSSVSSSSSSSVSSSSSSSTSSSGGTLPSPF